MRVCLLGSQLSPDLGILKRELEDRGHPATILNPRKSPQYMLAAVGATRGRAGAWFDHRNLADFDCFYLGDFEGRERFFRGSFEKDTWIALRERYQTYEAGEVDGLAFQLSLALAVGSTSLAGRRARVVNSPESLARVRLRPYIFWKAALAGVPVWHFEVGVPAESGVALDRARVRIAEDALHDVPCFDRELAATLSVVRKRPAELWKILAVAEGEIPTMIRVKDGGERAAAAPQEARDIGRRLLALFGLEVAEVHLALAGSQVRLYDLLAIPGIAGFEETIGPAAGGALAEALIGSGEPL